MNKLERTRNEFVALATAGTKRLSPLRAIKMWCWECVGYNSFEVKDCRGEDCPLFKFRFGKNMTKKKGSGDVKKS